MKKYNIESCHEVGIVWDIQAPAEITKLELQELTFFICNWTDAPDDQTIYDALYDIEDVIDWSDELKEDRIEIYRKVKAYPSVVHRDMFTQNFKEVDHA